MTPDQHGEGQGHVDGVVLSYVRNRDGTFVEIGALFEWLRGSFAASNGPVATEALTSLELDVRRSAAKALQR